MTEGRGAVQAEEGEIGFNINMGMMKKALSIFVVFFIAITPCMAKDESKLLFYCDVYEGYDNNVNLDSSRKGGQFSELDMELAYRRAFTENVNGIIDYYLGTVTYHEQTDASFYDNNVSAAVALDLFDKRAALSFNNAFEYNYYPHEDASTYASYSPQLLFRHNISKTIYHRLGYDFEIRRYPERKAEDGSRAKKAAARQDIRNGLAYELAGLGIKDIFLKIKNRYYVNDSNDQYMDYYDYWAYRLDISTVVPLFRDRLFALIGAGYQRTDYKTRHLVSDTGRRQKDNLYNISSSLLFDITKRLSASLNYSYRQNESNEPSEKYSGSIYSIGFHYAF